MKIESWPLDKIIPYEKNAKLHNIAWIAASIKEFKPDQPIVVDGDGVIIKGHGRLEAAKQLGLAVFPVVVRKDLTPEQARLSRIADNRSGEAGWDSELLSVELDDLHNLLPNLDFDIFGLEQDWLKGLAVADLGQIVNPVLSENSDDIPDTTEKRVKLGDLWQLGDHRLLCGDCTVKANIDRLLGTEQIDSLVTDPPYGVDYSNKNEFLNAWDKGNRNQIPIQNDKIENYRKFFASFLALVPFADYNTFYIFMSGLELHSLRLALDDCHLKYADYLVWVKNNHVLGRKDYNSKHEFIVYGWKNHHKFYGDFSTTILNFDRPQKSDLHPTMKPIALLVKLILDGSKKNAVVFDPFGGSGSTLISCAQTSRKCRMLEIDPHYCDAILTRWEELTSKKAVKL